MSQAPCDQSVVPCPLPATCFKEAHQYLRKSQLIYLGVEVHVTVLPISSRTGGSWRNDGCVPLSMALGGTPVELIFTLHFFFLATELNFNVPEKLYSSSCFQTLPHQALHFPSRQGAVKGEKES